MSEIDTSKTEPVFGPRESTRSFRYASAVGRFGLSCALIWALLSAIVTIQEIRQPAKEGLPALRDDHVAMSMADILTGQWWLDGFPWRISTREVTHDQLQGLFSEEVVSFAAEDETGEFALNLLQMLEARAEGFGEFIRYQVEADSLRIEAYAPTHRPKVVSVVRAAHRTSDSRWTYLEAIATGKVSIVSESALPNLLPVAPTDKRLAVRTDRQDQIQAEVIDLSQGFSALQSQWANQGWQLQQLSNSTADYATDTLVMCQKGASSVLAMVVGQTADDPGMLMAVCSP